MAKLTSLKLFRQDVRVLCLFFCFSRGGFSVALELVLELTLIDQAGLELRDPSASAS